MKAQLALLAVAALVGGTAAYDALREEAFQFYNFTQKIDHYNFTLRDMNFTQRYWVND